MVQQQVSSQIKVRDLSAAKLSIAPSDATSWSEARTELLSEAKAKLRSELETELSTAGGDSSMESIRAKFTKLEAKIEHDIDSKVCSVFLYLIIGLELTTCKHLCLFTQVHTFSATLDLE